MRYHIYENKSYNASASISVTNMRGYICARAHVENVGNYWPKGTIWHLDPENLLEFVRQLREQGEASLLTLSSPLLDSFFNI